MKPWLAILPVIALLGLGAIGAINLMGGDGSDVGRSDGRLAPTRVFETLTGSAETLNFSAPAPDKPIVVNLFASWCAPCRVEHPLLVELAETHPDRIFGLLYKDEADRGQAFLDELGDPYTAVGLDPDGQGGLDFGLTGVPETFIISADGEILMHVRGALTPENLSEIRALF